MAIDNGRAVIYKNIDTLPEAAVDLLAYDLHIDWYDSSYSDDEKRQIVKDCIKVHKFCGTKYAVETALKSIYPESEVVEWFEYGGNPYHFKVVIYDSTNDAEKRSKVMSKVKYYKNVRSVLDEVVYRVPIYQHHCLPMAVTRIFQSTLGHGVVRVSTMVIISRHASHIINLAINALELLPTQIKR